MPKRHLPSLMILQVPDPKPRTACGLHGEYLNDGRVVNDPAQVTCKRCLGTLRMKE